MTTALHRILTTPLKATERGGMSSVRVAANSFHVATISAGMNDQAAYARLFAAAPDFVATLMKIAYSAHADTAPILRGYAQDALAAFAKTEGVGS